MIRQIGKWSETSYLRIAVLKIVSVYELVKICSIAVLVLLVTLVGLFMIVLCRFHRLYLKILVLLYVFNYQELWGLISCNIKLLILFPLKISWMVQFGLYLFYTRHSIHLMNTCIVCNSYNDSLELVVSSSLVSEKHITLSRKPKEKRNSLKFQSSYLYFIY